MKTFKGKSWTKAENTLLRDYYWFLSPVEMCAILPGRSLNVMRKQVQLLERKGWDIKNAL